jgi:hypothetical protein
MGKKDTTYKFFSLSIIFHPKIGFACLAEVLERKGNA